MMERDEKLKRCADCYNNFYNGTGAKECWSLADARSQIVWIVGTWQPSPLDHMKPIERLHCWHPQSGTSVMKRGA